MNVRDPVDWNVLAEFVKTRYGATFERVLKEAYEELKEQLVATDETRFHRLQGRAQSMGDILSLLDALRVKGEKR